MSRIILWWISLTASIVLVVAAFANQSGTCVDSADAAASSCTNQGSAGLLLVGLAAFAMSAWMLRRAYHAPTSWRLDAARDATSVGAVAVRELADVSRRADNPALLGSLPDLDMDTATILGDLDAGRASR